jgi:hypothetical protein
MSLCPHRKSPCRIYKCHFTSGRRYSEYVNPAFHILFQELFALIYWRIKYLRLKYGLSLLKIHEKYKKYIFRIIFYVSLIKNDKQTKKGKEINIFKSLARCNVFSTKSEEQEVNLVWPNLCIFWLLFICL